MADPRGILETHPMIDIGGNIDDIGPERWQGVDTNNGFILAVGLYGRILLFRYRNDG
jgi:hypothetical protein